MTYHKDLEIDYKNLLSSLMEYQKEIEAIEFAGLDLPHELSQPLREYSLNKMLAKVNEYCSKGEK